MEFDKIILDYVSDIETAKGLRNDFLSYFDNLTQGEKILFYAYMNESICSEDISNNFNFRPNILTRLHERGVISQCKREGVKKYYEISSTGLNQVKNNIKRFLESHHIYKEHIRKEQTKKLDSTLIDDRIKKFATAFFECGIRVNYNEIKIDLKELANYSIEVIDLIYANFKESILLIKEIFKDDVDTEDFDNLKVVFVNSHESQYQKLNEIDREYKGLISTSGLFSEKKQDIISRVISYSYLCTNPDCHYSDSKLTTPKKLEKPKKGASCPKCKAQLERVEEGRINQLETKITDIDSGISFPIYANKDLSKSISMVGLGDEVQLIGHIEDKRVENENGNEKVIKVIIVNSFIKLESSRPLTSDEIKHAENILGKINDTKKYLLSPFYSYQEEEFIKLAILLQQLTRHKPEYNETPIHLAIMGEPGVGKNEVVKISETYFPNSDSITGADITDAGFKGTVSRETGVKEIGLAKKLQGGTVIINEFDKFIKTNTNGKKAGSQLLNGSITEQEIKLQKAGITIRYQNLNLRHNVIFNPAEEDRIKKDKIPFDKMADILDKSLLSRMLPIYIKKCKKRTNKVINLILQDEIEKPDINISDYKIIIQYLREKHIKFTQEANEKIKIICVEINESNENDNVSVERIVKMLVQISKAYAKLENKDKCNVNHVKKAYGLYLKCLETAGLNLNNLEMLFMEDKVKDLKIKNEIEEYIANKILLGTEKELDLNRDSFLLEKDPALLKEVIFKMEKNKEIFMPRKGHLVRLE